MTGASSPSGAPHPGLIENTDLRDGRTWTDQASAVPQSMAWVQVGEVWHAVTRVQISGTRTQLSILKFGPEGEFLESTSATMGLPAAPEPEEELVPPMPGDE